MIPTSIKQMTTTDTQYIKMNRDFKYAYAIIFFCDNKDTLSDFYDMLTIAGYKTRNLDQYLDNSGFDICVWVEKNSIDNFNKLINQSKIKNEIRSIRVMQSSYNMNL